MKPDKVSQFPTEDFIKVGTWIPKLFQLLNDWVDNYKSILNSGITITDNCMAEIKEITFKTKTSVDATWPVSTKLNMGKPRVVHVGAAFVGIGVNEKPIIMPNISYTYESGQILITGASGLEANKDYKLVLTCWAN